MKFSKQIATSLLMAGFFLSAPDSFSQVNTNEPVRGPVYSATIRGPGPDEGAVAMKGMVVTVGGRKDAYLCYDADLLRVSMAWTGAFLDFGNTINQIAWPPPPKVKGTPVFRTKAVPGWAAGQDLKDPRSPAQGPLPKDFAHYQGLYVNGDNVVLSYKVGTTEILELPGYEKLGELGVFTRTLKIDPSRDGLTLNVCELTGQSDAGQIRTLQAGAGQYVVAGNPKMAVGVLGAPKNLKFDVGADGLRIQFVGKSARCQIKVLVAAITSDTDVEAFIATLKNSSVPGDIAKLCKGGPSRWTETVSTKGTVAAESKEAYVVDTLTEPLKNPYHSRTFFGGFDFFSDGRAAICTFHGDVWLVSGIDQSLEKIVWRRFATGLFQPLGLKIVKDTVYVLGRDQITILRDLNKDGEADFYENFNNDTVVTANYHEFCLDLHTDTAGNFYFAKGAPWEPEVTSPHQGTLIKVSKDGSKMEIVATGFRAPNGMTVGPKDQITVSDNQGHWMPSSKVSWVEKGGFYGMTPSAQRELKLFRDGTNFMANPSDPLDRAKFKFKGWETNSPSPENYDQPLFWLPMNMDNSSGGQVWVTSDNWGPMKDKLLFMSYGKCTLFEVMLDKAGEKQNAALVQFPIKFLSGVMRGRFNPKDGQLYLCGLRGWQNSATKDGGFYRVRYTGQPVRLPTGFKASQQGLELEFPTALDPKSAGDAANYSAERWNYKYNGGYGSQEYSVDQPDQRKHDKPEIKSARVSSDGKTVTLEVADMKPAHQYKIKFSVDAADGTPVSHEVYGTIHQLNAK